MGNDGKVDLVKFLTNLKNTLNDCIHWCEQLDDENNINIMLQESQQSVIDMTEQIKCYEIHIKVLTNLIDNLKIDRQVLDKEVFTSKLVSYYIICYIIYKTKKWCTG